MADGIDRDELRNLVRAVLRSTLQDGGVSPAAPPSNTIERIRAALLPGASGQVSVTGDLTSFARDMVAAAAHEDIKAAIMSGRVVFAQAGGDGPPSRSISDNPVAGGMPRIAEGILNEHRIMEIGKSHARVVIGPEVVVTPLARDKARELKLELVRSKS
ncbi:MAG TPA: hypothetical protein VJS40_10420 [Aestuariivirgaceae bacterium]|nr:hypothetical protein [Aestuariivirgaceae bacterium]